MNRSSLTRPPRRQHTSAASAAREAARGGTTITVAHASGSVRQRMRLAGAGALLR